MKRITTMLAAAALIGTSVLSACSTAPKTAADKEALMSATGTTVRQYKASDPAVNQFFDNSYAYAVFPTVGSGAFVVGGSFGRGIVYEQGRSIGYASITQGSIGLQAGGQGFSQIIFFQTADTLNRFKTGQFSLSADANAVAIDSGAAGQTTFRNGVAVFIRSQSGLMASAAVGGQNFKFDPF